MMSAILHAAKTSTGLWNKPAFHSSRAFFSASNIHTNAGPRRSFSPAASANAGNILSTSNRLASRNKVLPLAIGDRRGDEGGRNATATARSPPGNPSTMAFLGLRAKSSGAAFRHQAEDEEANEEFHPHGAGGGPSNGTAAGAEGSGSRRDSWTVNLGREDESWLIGPRCREWFTGLEPSICPGEGDVFATVGL
jgi:hypothetical protein